MRHFHVLVLMEWYDHPNRVGIGRYAAEQNWYLTVSDGCVPPKGWSGNGILTLINERNDIIDYVRSQRVPCVDFGAYRPDIPLARVCGDHRRIGLVAADHLTERGHTQAAYFSTGTGHPQMLRHAGFTERFEARTGHTPLPLVWAHRPGSANDDWQSLNRWLKQELHRLPKPLAVFCYCDYDAAKVENACLEAGYKIPEDVAILGVDNDTLVCENLRIPLSSVRHDRVRVGYEGSALLDRLMRGGTPPTEPVLIPPRGVELRASTDGFATADPIIRAVIHFFREHLDRSIGVAEAAAQAGLPPRRLEEHFTRVLGQTVYTTLTRLRMFEVKRLLAFSDLPVKEIARRTGFCHAQHLNNAFVRLERCTPLAYRKSESQAASRR
ncbi:MAG TPA: substrate-binding domain-containing protein [Kiritimatiellia bacterium]|jgi:LacI family transcriptional regulator|nr:substrate-binding domain-containing protein [Kiritimatiellia bacterium]HOR96905.1 substrate-binding domain-containing protein [Kiritimatiellia bacterium]HPC48747.1 substrate-binding domain-containing protein [Kiritimatiellia bacterium]HPW75048.1 substrate-binding domain-containing protein [Kiritimatiellia bacterium]